MFNTNQVRDLVADIFESNNQKSLVQDFEEKFSERFGVVYSKTVKSAKAIKSPELILIKKVFK